MVHRCLRRFLDSFFFSLFFFFLFLHHMKAKGADKCSGRGHASHALAHPKKRSSVERIMLAGWAVDWWRLAKFGTSSNIIDSGTNGFATLISALQQGTRYVKENQTNRLTSSNVFCISPVCLSICLSVDYCKDEWQIESVSSGDPNMVQAQVV